MKAPEARIGGWIGALLLGVAMTSGASCAVTGFGKSGPSLSDFSEAVWSDYLVPDQAESAWREIPWIPTLAEGVRTAAEADRPMLLWVMNGHPLGCT